MIWLAQQIAEADAVLANAHLRLRQWRTEGKMDRLVRNGDGAEEVFDGRKADEVIRSGGITLLRFQNYRGAAKSCLKRVIRGADTSVSPVPEADVRKESSDGLL